MVKNYDGYRDPPRDRPVPLAWDDAERPCRRCGQPTHWRTQHHAAVHPMCEAGPWDALTPLGFRDLVTGLGAAFPGSRLDLNVTPGPPERPRPIRIVTGPCSWCQRPGVGITADRYYHCLAHLWPPFRWPPPSGGPAWPATTSPSSGSGSTPAGWRYSAGPGGAFS